MSQLLDAVRATGGDVQAAGKGLGIPEATMRRRLKRDGLWGEVQAIRGKETVVNGDGTRTASTDPDENTPAPWKAEDVIRAHGDDPDECVILRQTGNRWGDPAEPSHQLKVQWIRRDAIVRPPDPQDWTPPPKPKVRKARLDEPRKGFVISDHHAPHHEPIFHKLVLERLRDRQPDFIEVNGDLLDFPDISTHRSRDEYNQTVNECLAGGFQILRDYRHVCPDAEIILKRGNHDERLDIRQIDHSPELRKIAPGGGFDFDGEADERPWHHLSRLLYLDELHVTYIDEHWEQAKTKPSPKLTLRHGFSTSENGAGKQMLEKLSGSTLQGHDHRFGLTLKTTHLEDDDLEIRAAIQGGCACTIPGGLGYVKGGEPNWQNGAWELSIWPDGDYSATPMIYVPGRLLCSDKRYEDR